MGGQVDDLLLRATSEAIFIIENEHVLAFNNIGREMLEYNDDELKGLSVGALFIAPMKLQTESCCKNGTLLNIETQVLTKTGKAIFVQLRSKDLSENSRRITSFSLRDISAFKKSEMAFLTKGALLESLSYTAARFLESENWRDEIEGVLRLIGSSAKVSRVYIFQNFTDENGRTYMSQKYEWVADGVEPQISNSNLQRFYYDDGNADMLKEYLSKGKVVKSLVKDLPIAERKVLEHQGIKSIFLIPIFQHNQWWGFIGYDECNYERLWDTNEMQLLKAAADIFAAALERRAVEEELKRSSENFSSIFNNSPDGIFVYDYKGNVLDVNRAGCLLNGISKDEILNTHVSELVSDGDRQKIALDFQKWVTGEYSVIESNSKNPDGSLIPVEIRGTKITYSDKPAILLLVRDISRRRESENLLQKRMEFIQFISRISSDFIKIDLENMNPAMNNALEFVCKYTDNERGYVFQIDPGGSSMVLTNEYCHPDFKSHQGVFEYFSIDQYYDFVQTLKKGEIVSVHSDELLSEERAAIPYLPKQLQVKSSINIPLMVREYLLGFIAFDCTTQKKRWDNDTINAFMLTAQIIANAIFRRKSENELIEAKNKAEQSDKLKTAFLGQMSHEMRTPLNSIIGFAEILEKEISTPDLHDMATFILSGGERLLNTFNLIIDLAEIESNIMKAQMEVISLNEFMQKMMPVLGRRASEKNLRLSFVRSQTPACIEADEGLLEKIVFNLIDNALKYTKKGEIVIKLDIEQKQENAHVALIISDTGIGIPPDKIIDIFHKFRQASEGYNREFEGAGLGLSVTRGMVELLDGEIIVNSEMGVGSEFKLLFPLAGNTNRFNSGQSLYEQPLASMQAKMKILILEDEAAHRKFMQYILKNDFDIVFATTGAEAIAMTYSKHFDLIIMDINLGKNMNGIDAMIKIREVDGYKQTPIIVATANAMKGQKERFLNKGFSYYLSKPFRADELKSLVDEILK